MMVDETVGPGLNPGQRDARDRDVVLLGDALELVDHGVSLFVEVAAGPRA